mmetsp:Transcript_12665/g.15988  ORF Transcript_12665/g.15988 Transcript_12665/m.15988 type:complete len:228 (+) Transcript_12665:844-1527(+)
MIHSSGTCNHHSAAGIMGRNIITQVLLGQRTNILFGAQNCTTQSRPLKSSRVQMIQHQLLLLLINLTHLSQNDISLPLNRPLVQLRMEQNVAQNLHPPLHILLKHLHEINCLLATGISVQMPPHILNLHLQLLLRPFVRTLERHMLQKMSGAIVRGRFVTGPGVDPHADRGGGGVGDGFGRDAEGGGEGGNIGGGAGEEVGWEGVDGGGSGGGAEGTGLGEGFFGRL